MGDGDEFRAQVSKTGAQVVIPNTYNPIRIHKFNRKLCGIRNTIERCFCRFKDFRRSKPDTTNSPEIISPARAAVVAYGIN